MSRVEEAYEALWRRIQEDNVFIHYDGTAAVTDAALADGSTPGITLGARLKLEWSANTTLIAPSRTSNVVMDSRLTFRRSYSRLHTSTGISFLGKARLKLNHRA